MSYETLNPSASRERADGDHWIYLDVRTVAEFDGGHVAGAWNIPFVFRDPVDGMTPNPDFAAAVKRHFTFESHMVLV